jgi:hypothetical protein
MKTTSMKYYDHVSGRHRIKRRYLWAGWAFAIGFCAGIVAAILL